MAGVIFGAQPFRSAAGKDDEQIVIVSELRGGKEPGQFDHRCETAAVVVAGGNHDSCRGAVILEADHVMTGAMLPGKTDPDVEIDRCRLVPEVFSFGFAGNIDDGDLNRLGFVLGVEGQFILVVGDEL